MKKKTPFLDYYMARMPHGTIHSNGLCNCLGACHDADYTEVKKQYQAFELFLPTSDEALIRLKENGNNYWGSEHGEARTFGPLRQTIVLLCAAMNNEL